MAGKKKELSDEEWAQLVADKVADNRAEYDRRTVDPQMREDRLNDNQSGSGRPSTEVIHLPQVKVTADEPTRLDHVYDDSNAKVDVTAGEPTQMVTVHKRTQADADADAARQVLAKVKPSGDELAARRREKLKQQAPGNAIDAYDNAGKAALDARADKEGGVYMGDRDADGKQVKGQFVARKMFRTDADFDAFVAHAKDKGRLWTEPDNKAPEHDPGAGGGTFLNHIRNAVNSVLTEALPDQGATSKAADQTAGPGRASRQALAANGKRANAAVDNLRRASAGASSVDGGRSFSSAVGNAADVTNPAQRDAQMSTLPGQASDFNNQSVPPELLQSHQPAATAQQPAASFSGAGGGGGSDVGQGGAGGGGDVGQGGAEGTSGQAAPGDQKIPFPPVFQMAGAGARRLISGNPNDGNFSSIMNEAVTNANGPAQPGAQPPAGPAGGPPPAGPGRGGQPPVGPGGARGSSLSIKAPLADVERFPKSPQPQFDAMQAAVDEQKKAILGAAEVEATNDRAAAGLASSRADQLAKDQVKTQQMNEYVEASSKGLMNTVMEANKILSSPAQTPDPERYWNSHSKIMFAIGVGLLTQAGRDTSSIIGSVSHSIDRDIEAQKAAFEAPKDAARAQIAGAQGVYAMLRNMGHDSFEAQKMSMAIGADKYAQDVLKLASNTKSQEVQFKAQGMAAQLQQDGLKAMAEADQHNRANAVAEYKARTDRMEADIKLKEFQRKAAGTGKGRKLTANESTAIQHAREGTQTIDQILRVLGPEQKLPAAAWDEVMKNVPLLNTDAKARSNTVDALNFSLATSLSKSSLQAHEQKKWLGEDGKGGILGSVGLRNMNQQQYRELRQLFVNIADRTEAGTMPGDMGPGRGGAQGQLPTRPGPNGETMEQRSDGLWYQQGS